MKAIRSKLDFANLFWSHGAAARSGRQSCRLGLWGRIIQGAIWGMAGRLVAMCLRATRPAAQNVDF